MMATDLSRSRDMESPSEEAGPSVTPAHPATPQPLPANKIIGRNLNGTMVVTSAPSNEAELQLYRVMQRASLLVYYDTLLEMGGDDVRQLCEAGEEEFLEIMALVGMAPKPLHVRRLQKALQEWVSNPALFQIPIVPNMCPTDNPYACNQRFLGVPPMIPGLVSSPEGAGHGHSPSPGTNDNSNSNPPASMIAPPSASPAYPLPTSNVSPAPSQSGITRIVLPPSITPAAPVTTATSRAFSPQSACPPSTNSSPGSSSIHTPVSSPTQNPVLLEAHVQKLAVVAEKLTKNLPQPEPRPQNSKKKMCRDLELVMMMPETNPRRMEEIRKYAAIYGRFDCKRKPEKPLTLHEMLVNEAAAQLCRCVPAMLSRRDELFPLARQLVRRAGLHHSKYGPSSGEDGQDEEWQLPTKKKRQEEDGAERGSPEAARGSAWWPVKAESDTDSHCSYSSASSPPPDTEDSRPQVVAAKGDSIIAVANPALQPPALLPLPARNHSN